MLLMRLFTYYFCHVSIMIISTIYFIDMKFQIRKIEEILMVLGRLPPKQQEVLMEKLSLTVNLLPRKAPVQ